MKHLTKEDNFEEIIKETVLIDFSAAWCGPCKMITPILEDLTTINVVKVDVDEFPEIAKEYGIMSIPTLLFFKDGKEVAKEIGFRSPEEIDEIINNL